METKEPFIVSLTHYNTKISVEKDKSDLKLSEVVEIFKTLLLGAGFHIDNINEYLNTGNPKTVK